MTGGLLRRVAALLPGRARGEAGTTTVRLDDVRRRLELLVAAVHGREIPIAAAEPAAPGGLLRRLARPLPRHLRAAGPLPASDGARILLPPTLEADAGDEEGAMTRYRLLALEQAARLARGSSAHLPRGADALERDLFLLAESAATDGLIARTLPGVVPALAAERAAELARRPADARLTPAEREVEGLLRRLLAAHPGSPPPDVPETPDPAASLAWARETAARLRATASARYRGVAPVAAWGTVLPSALGGGPLTLTPAPVAEEARPQGARQGMDDQASGPNPDGDREGEGEDPGASPSDRRGGEASRNRSDSPWGDEEDDDSETDADGEADEPDDAPDAGDGSGRPSGEGAAPEEREAARDAGEGPAAPAAPPPPDAIAYPEWDWRTGVYRRPGATVRIAPALEGDAAWPAAVLARHGALVRRLRKQFERLRARRLRLSGQRDGDELDLAACVRALVERRAGRTMSDRLYATVRPARRELSILLLVDISGSTIEPVGGGQRIIDVEKAALLLIGEALDALGDRYAILTFSGKGAGHVRTRTLKDFGERSGEAVRRRVAALEPEGFTRLGAAVRHATSLLARQGTGHQLLLLLSDGKPNDDDDYYEGRYGVEDSRQAVNEARALGIQPFCLTVDRKGSAYLPRIFGAAGHVVLRQPAQLPLALVNVVQQMLRSR